jgi:ketosteroid isomerase-like protein
MLTRTLLLIAVTGFVASCNHPVDQAKVRGEIEARNKEIGTAIAKGDYNAVAGMYSSSAQLFPPHAPTVSGHDGIVATWKGLVDAGFKGLELTSNEVEASADHADEEGSYRLIGADGSTADTGKYIVIWKYENEKWVLHRDIWNSNNPPLPMAAAAPAAAPGAAPESPATATPPPTTTPPTTTPDQTAPPAPKPQ